MRIEQAADDGRWHSHFFNTDPDGHSGGIDMVVDGSITPVKFYIAPEDDEYYICHRMTGLVKDTANFSAGGFGGISALTNGLILEHYRDDILHDTITSTQKPIKQNADWSAYCYDSQYVSYGVGPNFVTFRWTFSKDGRPLVLNPGDRLVWTIRDDLTALDEMEIRCGLIELKEVYA